MERASRVMYSIANIFNWVDLALGILGVVFSVLTLVKVGEFVTNPVFTLVYCIVIILLCLVLISLIRIAKDKKSSKGWDVLFIVLGAVTLNPFLLLGGIFGLIAVRR